ncbi:transporter suffix domain-containing protein [Weissella minor]|uniref:transporter suffix domain-containing protein n=1 Tax=Weissella minor TaxID=1620 RepID=UPI003AF244C9
MMKKQLGYVFLIGVPLFYLLAAIVPFLPVDVKIKGMLVPALIVIADVCFYIAALFLGKEVITKIKNKFSRKKQPVSVDEQVK